MIDILLFGALGRMGREAIQLLRNNDEMRIIAGVEGNHHPNLNTYFEGVPIISDQDTYPNANVWVDFSLAEPTMKHMESAADIAKPIIIATTGFSEVQLEHIDNLSAKCPILLVPNLSIGIATMNHIISKIRDILGDDFETSIVEIHHKGKLDTPSGTAKLLANTLISKGDNVGIHSIRGGGVFGEHRVSFLGDDETIEITHRAFSRKVFAKGVIRAVKYIVSKPVGLHQISDLYVL